MSSLKVRLTLFHDGIVSLKSRLAVIGLDFRALQGGDSPFLKNYKKLVYAH
jgi:hypothetical protein